MRGRGRRIAFDYGEVRIGVAICDPDGILSTPHSVLQARNPSLMQELKNLFAEIEPIHIYIGLPKLMSGDDGQSVDKARAFGEKVGAITDVPITYVDERLSSVSALKKLQEAGKDAKSAKSLVDAMAAVTILDDGLALEARNV